MSKVSPSKFLTIEDRRVLKEFHNIVNTSKKADRIKMILLLDDGYSYIEIARILLFDEKTCRKNYKDYCEGGVEKLIDYNYKAYTGKLSIIQEDILRVHLKRCTYVATKDIAVWIENNFNIRYSIKGLPQTLHRLGFSYKKSKLVPSKSDPDKQKAFLKEYSQLKLELSENDKIYFIDGVHQIHNAEVGYGWIPKGENKEIPANTGRDRLNINGALDVDTKEVIVREDDRINAQSTIKLFEAIELANPNAIRVVIIADNARYYKNKLVMSFLETSKIEIKFLPPYSPNLNLIERLWKFFKKKVMLNSHYKTYKEFKTACMDFFKDIGQYRKELDSLITENFQIIGESTQ